jgi:hypothetical protein
MPVAVGWHDMSFYIDSSCDKLQATIRRRRRSEMVARGRVQNGVVVLADGVRLPEGQEVIVVAPPPVGSKAHGILDIPSVSVGAVIGPLTADDDLLGEMLESRS